MVVSVAILWGIVLTGLVIFTANPVTLNRRQFLNASAVVTAKVEDRENGTVQVEQVWWSENNDIKKSVAIQIHELNKSQAKNGESYLFALKKDDSQRFVIVPVLLGDDVKPLIYPITDDAIEQLKSLAAERKSSSR
ncbi:MAG: hypothetical protein Tsb009_17920 [Planctomycetaceae bacterium]